MKSLLSAFFASSLVLSACADVKNDQAIGNEDETGGSSGTTGGSTGSGGVIGVGNSSSTGGAATGGASSGGSTTGGSTTGGSSTGGAATGGTSTGGAATGGAGTGGALVITTGDCAGKPLYDAWKGGTTAMGDEVVIQCTIAQASCAGLPVSTNILWECVASHVPNCTGQKPDGGNGVWSYVKTCSEGDGGTGGTGTGGDGTGGTN